MTSKELYELIKLPEGVIEQLSQYENNRKGDIPAEIKEKLFPENHGMEESKSYRLIWEKTLIVLIFYGNSLILYPLIRMKNM